MLVGLLDVYGRDQDVHDLEVHLIMLLLGSLIPILYIIGLIIYWLVVMRRIHRKIMTMLRQWFCRSEGRTRLLLANDTGD